MSENLHPVDDSVVDNVKNKVKHDAPTGKSKRAGRLARAIISYAVAAACLFWVFHGLNLHRVWQSMAGISWGCLVLGSLLQILAYLCVAWEWQLLLRPVGRLPFLRVTQAVFAGRFANDVLPVQLGYLVRAYLAARWLRTGLTDVVPSLLVERLWDGLWLALGIGLATIFIPLPPGLLRTRNILSVIVMLGMVVVVFAAWHRRKTDPWPMQEAALQWKPLRAVLLFIGNLTKGMRAIAKSHLLPAVLGLALLKLAVQAVAFFTLMWAYGFRLSAWAGMAVFLISYLGICIPSTPASVGIFQLFSTAGLEAFGIAKTAATGFALIAFVALTVPLSIIGFFALAQSGMTLRQLRTQAHELTRHEAAS